jgi:integrase
MIGSKTLKTIILFLYGTGAKIGDTLAVLGADVDFSRSSILIRSASNLETRVIPIGKDVKYLLRWHLKSNERKKFSLESALFLTVKGKAVSYTVLSAVFRRLRKIANVTRANSTYQPRVNDLRHTFGVHSIVQWTHAGLATDKMLPLLAAYMGNVEMKSLERYLELSPCTYEAQLDRLKVLVVTG